MCASDALENNLTYKMNKSRLLTSYCINLNNEMNMRDTQTLHKEHTQLL